MLLRGHILLLLFLEQLIAGATIGTAHCYCYFWNSLFLLLAIVGMLIPIYIVGKAYFILLFLELLLLIANVS